MTRVTPGFVLIDVPGLIAGAAGGKGLGNEFLRHVMKARLRSLVFDCSVYEQGMQMLVQLIDEIALYLETVVYKKRTITQQLIWEHDMLTWQVDDAVTQQNLLKKQCLFLGNKVDLVPDEEIREELLATLSEMLMTHPLVRVKKPQARKAIFLLSA